MSILVIGLNHKTAAVEIREKLALADDQAAAMLGQLKGRFAHSEFVLLSTCNRFELYCGAKCEPLPGSEALIKEVSDFREVPAEEFRDALYIHRGRRAVEHLFTVASSLDSMVIGEPQITAQVKAGYKLACQAGSSGKVLNRLFHSAFETSKEIYTATTITRRHVSVASVAVELAKQLFSDITSAKVVVIGAGEMGELLIKHFRQTGCRDVVIVNRSPARAREISNAYDIGIGEWDQLGKYLAGADIVVAAATTDKVLFDRESCRGFMAKRRKGALLVIDIAVPRNFDPDINEIEDIYLYSIDDLAQVVEGNVQARLSDVEKGKGIISQNVDDFMDWFEIMDIGPLLGRMKETFQEVCQKELAEFFASDTNWTPEAKRKITRLTNRLMNKQLHSLIQGLNQMARRQDSREVTELIQQIIHHAEDDDSQTSPVIAIGGIINDLSKP